MREPKVYGRDPERDLIVQILQDRRSEIYDQNASTSQKPYVDIASTRKKILVIAIVGMPGIGKTTLAQLIFNDLRVCSMFADLKAWICVDEVFDIFKITQSILESFYLGPYVYEADNDLESLRPHAGGGWDELNSIERILGACADGSAKYLELFQRVLRRKVAERRFLIVLDNVWDEKFNTSWDKLQCSLQSAADGSTIIVTTCNKDIARRFHPSLTLELPKLCDDDCWNLIKAYALAGPLAAQVQEGCFEDIGRRIAAKCGGLPLAAKALGGLLEGFPDSRKWEDIENSRIWDLPPGREEILPALVLSYNFLPPDLRRCFSYCSIFPKNYQFQKEKLLMLWMAEGLIDPETSYKRVVGDCFDDLLARSFFQESTSNKHCFVMHDLIRELAVHVMGEFGFMLEANTSSVSSAWPRHVTYLQCQYETSDRFGCIADPEISQALRTFLPVRSSSKKLLYYLSSEMLQSLVPSFSHLHVLSLCGYNITSIPLSIGSLKHLRFLDCSSTLIEGLPDTLCSLYNLQTLLLSDCHQLKSLPNKIGNLVGMYHLNIHGTHRLEETPYGIGKLSRLRMLTDFVVGKNRGPSIGELGGVKDLKGKLRISGLENVVSEADATAAKLIEKKHLGELVLERGQGSSVAIGQTEIFHELRPHINLTKLSIIGYNGERFPGWVGHADFKYLEVLHLRQGRRCVELPTLGQLPRLKRLVVEGFDQLQIVGPNFFGEQHLSSIRCFNSLESLKFIGLPHWTEWSLVEADASLFPCLQELYVRDCPQLIGGFPLELPSLRVLNMSNCPEFCGSLPRSPLLCELSLGNCGMADLSSLADLTRLTSLSLQGGRPTDEQIAIIKAATPHLTTLDSLALKWSDSFTPSLELTRGWCIPCSLRSLSVSGIHDIEQLLMNSRILQYLHIYNSASPSMQFASSQPQMLNHLTIFECNNLREVQIIPPRDKSVLTYLCDLSIESCSQVSFFPGEGFLADNLTTLFVHDCGTLVLLGNRLNHCFPSLRFLSVQNCPRLGSFGEYDFPHHLETLRIWRCKNLKHLPCISDCNSLQLLDIANCPKLEPLHFHSVDLPDKLQKLMISECETLLSLPGNVHTLKCLELLHISDCPGLESFQLGLPSSLEVLHIRNCNKLISSYVGWQLYRLIFLKELVIEGFEGEGFFPATGSMPSALTILSMVAFPNLRSINCLELKRLDCLRELVIRRCHSLQQFSEDLPHSLCRLSILECPLVAAKVPRT